MIFINSHICSNPCLHILLVISVNLYMSSGKYINLDSLNICWCLDGLELKLKSLSHSPHKYLLSIPGPVQSVRRLPLQLRAPCERKHPRELWKERKSQLEQALENSLISSFVIITVPKTLNCCASRFPTCIWDWLFWVRLVFPGFWIHSSSFSYCVVLFRPVWFSQLCTPAIRASNPAFQLFFLIGGNWPGMRMWRE